MSDWQTAEELAACVAVLECERASARRQIEALRAELAAARQELDDARQRVIALRQRFEAPH